ncbi:YciI family protein [Micromonospora sp. R77]|uniref:YciI family protein n=1 Tax=Micromonospora sp. R77 TaxID=2925836 RepID=UPI001F6254B2|nr:YciI family protein [Micromonospora sp. R77]MCI4064151.1 YciI family protein [Micromonospora sp. R77]
MATKYMLSVHGVEGAPAPSAEEMQRAFAQVDAFNKQLQEKGAWVFGGGLCPPDTATVVTVSDGQVMTTDGPFAESREHLGGFWVIEAADLDEALEWSRLASEACANPVEVRPFQADT